MATHSRILASWTEESGELYSPWGCKGSDMTEQLTHMDFKRGFFKINQANTQFFREGTKESNTK